MAVITSYKDFVGNAAVVTTILQFLSGVLVCKQYVRNKTTAETSSLPFLCGVLSTSVWLLYGGIKDDDKIVFVNAIGLVLMLSYVAVFYKYTFRKSALFNQLLGCALFGVVLFGYVTTEDDNWRLLSMLGFLACNLTLVAVAAPLSKLYYVIRVKNSECLPFPMILTSFFVSTLWMWYGLLEDDIFLYVPNILGALLALAQLCLFVIYPSSPLSTALTKTILA